MFYDTDCKASVSWPTIFTALILMTFQVLGNPPIFITSCSVPLSYDCDFFLHFLLLSRVYLVSGKKKIH